ncbi:MAG: mannosyltransferase, partial [Bacteroidota bacterium]
PIPHAREVLTADTGIIFGFHDSTQLAVSVNRLLNDDQLRKNMSINALQKIVPTSWENSAVSHALLFEQLAEGKITIKYNLPAINLDHLRKMTTETGIIQFSKVNQPDIGSGYTLDDNARALVATGMHFELTGNTEDFRDIRKYLAFAKRCQQPEGDFLNYMDKDQHFTEQNKAVNLDDANGRAIWALGYLASLKDVLPEGIASEAGEMIRKSLPHLETIHSTRAIAFAIKGLFYIQSRTKSFDKHILIKKLANRLVQMYLHESTIEWAWFEGYLTYANSILPEAMLYAWLLTSDKVYKDIAVESFDFLLSQVFNDNGIEVISNKNWFQKGHERGYFGEQPIDVAYTIMTLGKFDEVFPGKDYRLKIDTAFDWFLGSNRLKQIVYNPCTGGCYDGLEETQVNLNQGAESTISYLMARLSVEKHKKLASASKRLGNQLKTFNA